MIIEILLFIVGLFILICGAEFLVKGSASISKKAGIPSIVIGSTIVAFGTSAPELVVNIFAALSGTTDIAIGNIIGSNICNILLILGCSAAIISLPAKTSVIWKDIPFAILAVLMTFIMANDVFFDNGTSNVLTRIDGLGLLGFFVIFLYYMFELSKNGGDLIQQGADVVIYSYLKSTIMTVGGLVLLFFGGKLLVNSAIIIARLAGLSEIFIGLTIVSVGTSLPELATSVIAARRKQFDIAIGNIVGSNIFNVFFVLGLTAVISPLPVSANANMDIVFCIITTLILFFSMFIGRKYVIKRWQGYVYLLVYFVYIGYLLHRG